MADGRTQLLSFAVYGATLILLYPASTIYHRLPLGEVGLRRLRTLDHIAICFLIAGTYTPVAMSRCRTRAAPLFSPEAPATSLSSRCTSLRSEAPAGTPLSACPRPGYTPRRTATPEPAE
ncbi:MAG: hemolysin III family protein [Gemmatimonadales bacterium]|nr:hemolysin III family protein [Gemmatimonadales bacterium]